MQSLTAIAAATYSASMVESATEFCFLECHSIGMPFSITTAPETDLASRLSPAQSASAKIVVWNFVAAPVPNWKNRP
eukprot:jgi/Phyca11/574604/estExt2_Genewise1.C_PHYCAscaffold_640081